MANINLDYNIKTPEERSKYIKELLKTIPPE
jgi:hypothetical protein